MSLTIHLSHGATHLALLEAPDTTVKQLLAEVANVLTDTGAVIGIDELKRLQLGVLRGTDWQEISANQDGTLEQLGIDEKSVLGYTTTGEFSHTPILDIDLE